MREAISPARTPARRAFPSTVPSTLGLSRFTTAHSRLPSVPADPLSRAVDKYLGAPPQLAETPNAVRGNAGAPGVALGPAKVVRTLAEAGKLQPGDVLVAETTAPPWTPLFATVAAVVTDTGGVLSHCAVVAREYGLPAVVGTGVATVVIRDGDLLEVDGGTGVVRVLEADSRGIGCPARTVT